ncbi:hypothetical protein TOPH_01242 [Tolypocladium ophioglossoides CBS 100239]|uniref:Uncharacterized protein n=1 Tax=Tolypocladium ophioglossoides (strain CBS 100239) TaxID=1163406 RepID=A0A0L0NJ00_TOLOC|nr:hypothetical protein TOPH_01242 [Tolypocladium ophioglossoides CBS 100239]
MPATSRASIPRSASSTFLYSLPPVAVHIHALLGKHRRRKPRHGPALPPAVRPRLLAPAKHLPVAADEEEPAFAAPVPAARAVGGGLRVDARDRLAHARLARGLVLDEVVDAQAAVGLGRQQLVGDADVAHGAPHGEGRVPMSHSVGGAGEEAMGLADLEEYLDGRLRVMGLGSAIAADGVKAGGR